MFIKQKSRPVFACLLFIVAIFCSLGCGSSQSKQTTPRIDAIPGDLVDLWIESNGRTLSVYDLDGRYYLLGEQGQPYQICARNLVSGRIEIVLSVDGRDVITGQQANYNANRGYVVAPQDKICVAGFRTSLQRVAAFEFSTPGESYAARTGDGANVGVIGMAVFSENDAQPYPSEFASVPKTEDYIRGDEPNEAMSSEAVEMHREKKSSTSEPGLGTKYGRVTRSSAEVVPFERQSGDPNEVIALFYNDKEGLEEIGIVLAEEEEATDDPCSGPNPFPGVENRAECNKSNFTPPPR